MARPSRAKVRSWVIRALSVACLVVATAAGGLAQTLGPGPASPSGNVLTIDPERLFEATVFGGRVLAEAEEIAAALQAENRRIEAELIAEERDLTERRPGLPVDEFRALADAFDVKVDQIRAEQDQKAREIQEFQEAGRQEFFNRIGPILLTLVQERRAAVLLDRRSVFLSASSVDITDAAIQRIDAEIGAGNIQAPDPEDNQEE